MADSEVQVKLLALAIYELKGLLSMNLGNMSKSSSAEKVAAHLAYSLHNEALAVIENRPEDFNVEEALGKIEIIDRMCEQDFTVRFKEVICAPKT